MSSLRPRHPLVRPAKPERPLQYPVVYLAIVANPLATPAEIATLDKVDAIQHPNCPCELWWELAAQFPMLGPQTVAGQLFLLEAPDRWTALEEKMLDLWINTVCKHLPKEQRHLLAADAMERVLWIWERDNPSDKTVRAAMAIRRQIGQGRATQTTWEQAQIAIPMMDRGDSWPMPAQEMAADEVKMASRSPDLDNCLYMTARAIAHEAQWVATGSGVSDAWGNPADVAWDGAMRAERMWQWAQLKKYINGDLP